MERIHIFIDGSNFYHGVQEIVQQENKDIKNFYFDFKKFCDWLCREDRMIVAVNYYNAPIKKNNDEKYRGQQRFFNYLKNIPFFTVKLGRLETRPTHVSLLDILATFDHPLAKDIIDKTGEPALKEAIGKLEIPAEKGVDVQLAIDLVIAAYNNAYDTAILVSGDADFVPAIKTAQALRKTVDVAYFPERRCLHIRKTCDRFIPLTFTEIKLFLKNKNNV